MRLSILVILFGLMSVVSYGQCDQDVPVFNVELTGSPDSIWTSPNINRDGFCCGESGNVRCIEFIVTLDPGAAGISFDIISGATPGGALEYQVNCGPATAVGDPICLAGVGPHIITFCKPGNNANVYQLTSIPSPVGGTNVTVNDGCSQTLNSSGFDSTTVTWTSVFPGAPGDYDNYLSCTSGCLSTVVTAVGAPPTYVDYIICGQPSSLCNNIVVCDTVRVTFNPTLNVGITPIDPVICFGQTSTTITANGSGGSPPYSYLWNNVNPSQSNIVGAGTYTVMLTDASGCPPVFNSVTVTSYANPITANAGVDDTVCNQVPISTINGSVIGATGGIWSGGSGTISPNDSSLIGAFYTPSASELSNGFVDLILTTTGNGTCPGDEDTVRINYVGFLGIANLLSTDISCFGLSDGSATVNITGGMSPFSYDWNTVPIETTSTINNLSLGAYTVAVTDGIGCSMDTSIVISQPLPLAALPTVTDVICPGGSDGGISTFASGGTSPYSYLWSPNGEITADISGQPAGIYTVTVTDFNGCTFSVTDTIFEPLPLQVTLTQTNVSCFGGNDGTATATVTGGTAPYSYFWSPIGGSTSTATGFSAGVYNLIITDAVGCTIIGSVTITEPLTPVSGTAVVTNISCAGGSDGTITLSPIGGTPSYTYFWTTGGQTTPSIIGQVAGTYSYTIIDANGCTYVDFATITEPLPISINISQTNVSCFGGADGIASANVTGGTPNYTYLWTTSGTTTSTDGGLLAGVYCVDVTDANGCVENECVTIIEPTTALSAFSNIIDASCFGGNDGALIVTPIGGTAPYTYFSLPGGQTSSSISGLTAGTYSTTVTDANGCTFVVNNTVSEPTPLTISFLTTNVNCTGGSDGTVTATASGGTSTYSYSWNTSVNTSPIETGLLPGTVVSTVTDFAGCVTSDSVIITEPNFPVSASVVSIDVSCFGGNDGTATVTPSGGTGVYTYLWDNGATINTAVGLSAGVHCVVVTDANGCVVNECVTINEPTQIAVTFNNQINVSCNGGSDGAVSSSVTGGTLNYTYAWLPNGETTNSVSNLQAGTYTLNVIDGNGCVMPNSVIISEPLVLAVAVSSTPTSCFGDSDGTVTAIASDGTGPYTYNWMPGNISGATVSNLVAGTYIVTATDANGCTTSSSIDVIDPSEIILSSGAVNSTCGVANGLAFVSVSSGGVAPFSYLWNPGNVANDTAANLFSGVYVVTVTDANGCTATATGNVNDNASALLSISASSNVSCNGGVDGSATVSLVGGTAPFTYSWSTSGTLATETGMPAGTHTVIVDGSNGCQSSIDVTITEPTPLSMDVVTTPVLCNGGSDGGASVTTFGGTSGYTYQWLPGGSTGTSVTGLSAGLDSVEVTDALGCTLTTTFLIDEPALPLSVVASFTDVSCNGGADGTASSLASGGTSPYSYEWTPGLISGQNIAGLGTGTYTVTATDINSCTTTDAVTIAEPTAITLTTSSVNSTCGLANGEVSVTAVGGTGTYTYYWTPSAGVNATETGLFSGGYDVTVTDINGCIATASETITDTPGPTVSVTSSTNVSCNGGTDGTATATVVGGTGPMSYVWSPVGGTAATGTGLSVGVYTVVVTDNNGCISNGALSPQITEPDPLASSILTIDVNCNGGSDGGASVTTFGGTSGYTYQWLPGGSTGTSISGLSAGLDSVEVTDALGCTAITTFLIEEPIPLLSAISGFSSVSCFGGSNGTATVLAAGGTPYYSYDWAPSGGTDSVAMGLLPGVYTVNVMDVNGCATSSNVTITQPAIALSATSTVVPASCFGGNNGSATINPVGGTSGYSYSWLPSGSGQTSTGLLVGAYTVEVSDANNCLTNVAFTIDAPPALTGNLTSTDPSCGLANGSIISAVTGGTVPYIYNWAPTGSVNDSISDLLPGTYSVDVTDNAGCLLSLSATLTNIAGPTISISSFTDVSCFGGSDGQASVGIIGGTSPFDIAWSPSGYNGVNVTGLPVGTFPVTVIDALGCVALDSVLINEPLPLSIVLDNEVSISCNGANDGELTVLAGGGTPSYSYSWTPNVSSLSTATNLSTGTYIVDVVDANGCIESIAIPLNEPTTLISSISSFVDPTCFGGANGNALVTGGGGTVPYSYLWSDGQTGNLAESLIAGNYDVTITDTNGCTATSNVTITDPSQVVTIAGINDTICLGQTTSVSATATGGAGSYSYAWQPTASVNSGTLTDSPLISTDYIVVAYDQNGCAGNLDTVSSLVYDLQLGDVEALAFSPLCPGQSTVVYAATTLTDSLVYSWNNGLGSGPGGFHIYPTQPISYIVTVTNLCGASITDTVSIDFNPPPTVDFIADIDSACVPTTIQFTDLSVSGNPSDPIYSWSWDFGDSNLSTETNPSYVYNNVGTYNVVLTATTAGGCTNSNDTVPYVINVYPNPVAAFTVSSNSLDIPVDVLQCTNQSTGATNYEWDFGDGSTSTVTDPNYLYTTIGVYEVELVAINEYGCTDTAVTEVVTNSDLVFPTAFTPTENGGSGGYYDVSSLNNDIFFPYTSGVVEYKLMIFNRWGELIFETEDIYQGWDGYYRGELVQQGVYVWKAYALLNNGNRYDKIGNVTLIR